MVLKSPKDLGDVGYIRDVVKDYLVSSVSTDATTANLKGATTNVESGGVLNLLGGGNVLITGSEVHANGPTAGSATGGAGATATEHKEAWLTSRVPEHEPWARMMTNPAITDLDSGNTHSGAGEYSYDDPLVGRTERGTDLQRNSNWHR